MRLLPWKYRIWRDEMGRKWPVEKMSRAQILEAARSLVMEAERCERLVLHYAAFQVQRFLDYSTRYMMVNERKAFCRRQWLEVFQRELLRREATC